MIGTNDKVSNYVEQDEDPWGLKEAGADPHRADIIRSCIGKAGLVLDVGCAFGIYSNFLRGMGNYVISVDASRRMVTEATERFPDLTFSLGTGEALPFKDETFNAVLCMGTLIYSDNREKFLSEIYRTLRRRGRLCVIERNRSSPMHALIGKIKKNEKAVDDPQTYFTKSELECLLSNAGFKIKKVAGDQISLPFSLSIRTKRFPSLSYFLVFECVKE